jgi:pimeloyl-ACP methyl ester carboxylesterase/ketosteroid isomerase-like protein
MSRSATVVRNLYRDLNAGNLDGIEEYLSPDIDWQSSPTMPWGRQIQGKRGHDAVRAYLDELMKHLDARVDVDEFIESDDGIVVAIGRISGHARRTRQPFECRFSHVYWLNGGLIVRHRGFPDTAAVLIAMGAMAGEPVFPPLAKGKILQTERVKLWYSDDEADGDPVILVGSFTTGHAIFDFVRPLLDGFRTITWEPRGLGESECPDPAEQPYNEQVWADDLYAFMKALGIPRAHIWVTGFGNYYCIRFGAQHPKMVASMIAYTDSWAGDPTKAYGSIWEIYRTIVNQMGTTGNGARMLGNIFDVPDLPWFSNWEQVQVARQLHPHTVEATVGYCLTKADVRDDLDKIKSPMMILQGNHDWSGQEIRPEDDHSLVLMREKIPHLEVETVPDTHPALVLVQQPEFCAEKAKNFMRRHPV